MEQLGISRPTIRRAFQELVDEGLLVRQRGMEHRSLAAGRFARSTSQAYLDDLQLGEDDLSTQLLLHEQIVPAQRVLDKLGLPPETTVLHSRRLRFSHGVPFAVFEDFLHPDFLSITQDQLEEYDLYKIMRLRGTIPKVTRQTVTARAATKEEAKLFRMAKPRLPVLAVVRTVVRSVRPFYRCRLERLSSRYLFAQHDAGREIGGWPGPLLSGPWLEAVDSCPHP